MATLDRPAVAVDDRGRAITVLAPRDLKKAAEGADRHKAALAKHLRNAIKVESRRWTVQGVAIPVLLMAVWIAAQVFVRKTGIYRLPAASGVVFWGGIVAVVLISRAMARRRVARELAATAVAEGLCGSCCYGLRDIPVETDGCMVCPECGAAWRAQRVTRPHWLAAPGRRSRAEGGRAASNWFLRFVTGTPPPQNLLAPDDRGRFVSVVDSRLFLVARARRDELGRDGCRSLRRMLRKVGRVPRILVAALPGLLSAFLLVTLVWNLGSSDKTMKLVLLAAAVIFGAATASLLLGHAFYSPRRAARVLADHGWCASCTLALRGVERDSDGCTPCPECGASWRVGEGSPQGATAPEPREM